jgi:hypothetical protein
MKQHRRREFQPPRRVAALSEPPAERVSRRQLRLTPDLWLYAHSTPSSRSASSCCWVSLSRLERTFDVHTPSMMTTGSASPSIRRVRCVGLVLVGGCQ